MPRKLQATASSQRPVTVTQLSGRIRALLDGEIGAVWVEGEISNWRLPASGHAYFVLKDAGASINAVCFRSSLARIGLRPGDGMKVEARGRVTAYVERSQYQIIVESMRESGLGDLLRRFVELRDRLRAEGLFEADRKRTLPAFPRVVGILTSSTGAALRDMLNVLARRAPGIQIILSPCLVQGDAAPADIVRALRRLERHGASEVIIVARGGGSIEDLWAFNDEAVARAIAGSSIPVVSGVGHETDTTLADFAADLRAPTPSAAAEIVSAGYEQLLETFEALGRRLDRAMDRRMEGLRSRVAAALGGWGMRRPLDRLALAMQRVDELGERIARASPHRRVAAGRATLAQLLARLSAAGPAARWTPRVAMERSRKGDLARRLDQVMIRRVGEARLRLVSMASRLDSLGPEAVLKRGYSLITTGGGNRVVTSPDQVRPGQTVRIQSAGGPWRAAVLPPQEDLFEGV